MKLTKEVIDTFYVLWINGLNLDTIADMIGEEMEVIEQCMREASQNRKKK